MRIAIVSDTHGQLDPRIAALVAACDGAVHAGDVGGAAVLAALRPRRGQLVAIRGNNDVAGKWPADQAETLAALPREAALELPGGTLVVVHGDQVNPVGQRHARLRHSYPEARAVVYGHSHRLVCDQEQRPWVLNPGAAGRARTYGGPSCLILLATARRWSVQVQRFPPLPAEAAVAKGSRPARG